ncbi:hypothetical protein REPUB_Repub18cG0116500 [Reevesia pubescens]
MTDSISGVWGAFNFRWSLIAGRLPGRTDNEIKNYWNTNLGKRVQGHVIPPKTTEASNKLTKLGRVKSSPTEIKLIADDQHKVIRTKAVKCTKAVNVNIIPRRLLLNHNQTAETNILGPKSGSTTPSETPSSSAIHGDDSIDFLMDFDINELLVSDAPISDFDPIQQVDENGEYGNGFNLIDEVDQLYSYPVDEAAKADILGDSTNLFQTRVEAKYPCCMACGQEPHSHLFSVYGGDSVESSFSFGVEAADDYFSVVEQSAFRVFADDLLPIESLFSSKQ